MTKSISILTQHGNNQTVLTNDVNQDPARLTPYTAAESNNMSVDQMLAYAVSVHWEKMTGRARRGIVM
jgi:hypothetical protein